MKRNVVLTLALTVVLTATAWAQRYQVTIKAETPEGAELQAIGQEADAAKKLALMEKFAGAHPQHDGVSWVYVQLIPVYVASGDMAKASAAGDKLLAIHPDDLEAAVTILKGYEKLKEPAAVAKWSETSATLARKLKAQPKPADAEEAKTWQDNQQYAAQVEQYAEYSLMNQAAQAANPDAALSSLNALDKLNPQSQYGMQAANAAFASLRQANQMDKAVELADRVLAKDSSNEEMLLVASNHYMTKQNNDKAVAYATKLVEVMNTKPKPAQMSDDDWAKRKTTMLAAGNWIAGMTYATQGKLGPADKALREALPALTDEGMKAGALYQLGFVNFKMGETSKNTRQIQDALRFSQQSAGIKGPYQGNAAKNAAAIRAKYGAAAGK